MQDKKQQLEPDMEQETGSKLGKEYVIGFNVINEAEIDVMHVIKIYSLLLIW